MAVGNTKAEREARRLAAERASRERYLRGVPADELIAELERRGMPVAAWRHEALIPNACQTLRGLALRFPEKSEIYEAAAYEMEQSLLERCKYVAPAKENLDLLRKLASGRGGYRTGALKRAGYLEWTVTEAGRAALGDEGLR